MSELSRKLNLSICTKFDVTLKICSRTVEASGPQDNGWVVQEIVHRDSPVSSEEVQQDKRTLRVKACQEPDLSSEVTTLGIYIIYSSLPSFVNFCSLILLLTESILHGNIIFVECNFIL